MLVVWAVCGSGPAGGCCLREGVLVVLRCCVWGGWLVVFGVGDTPALVGCCGLVVVVVSLFGGCPCVVWGWHAVGVLGQCALVA